MTDNIINFKAAKKRSGYAAKETKAVQNRKKFGRTKAEKRLDDFEKRQADKQVDEHRLDE